MTSIILRIALLAVLVTAGGCISFSGDDPRARTPGTIIDDEMIEMLAKRRIFRADEGFNRSHIVVASHNGVVLLAGQVESEDLSEMAQGIIEDLKQVRRVHNELAVRGPTSFLARTNDNWLTTKVESAFMINGEVDANRVRVVTENGVVYLLGTLPRAEADAAVEVARNVGGVEKIVKVFEYLD